MAVAAYRFQIYSTDGTTVETTFNTSQIENWEEVGGQEVRPLLGRAEARPWSIDLADISTAVMSILSDSSGRMDQISRLVDFATNYDSSGFVTRATGRIADVILNPSIGSFRFVMEDENLIARRSLIFQSSTTVYVYPPGLRTEWAGFKAQALGDARVIARLGNLTHLMLESVSPISMPVLRQVRDDFRGASVSYNNQTTLGNFQHLRFQSSSGADFEVWGFGITGAITPFEQLYNLEQVAAQIQPLRLWIVDPSSALATTGDVGSIFSTGSKVLRSVFLHMGSTYPPSEDFPLHVGSSDGIHPFQLVKDIYDGNWSDATVRYDSTALTNLINNKSFPIVWFRITEAPLMQEWLEDHIYGPFGVVPFVNAAGRVEPQIVTMPTSDIADVPNLYVFQSSSLREPHPSWAHTKRDLATVLRYHDRSYRPMSDKEVANLNYEVPGDLLQVFSPHVQEFQHDRVGILGRHAVDYPFDGVLRSWSRDYGADPWRIQSNEIFDRYGDGPIYGECYAMSSGTSDVSAGDFAFVELDTFPNPALQSRGDNRLVQIISRRDSPMGPIFDWVDAGASGQSLTAPTLSSASSSTGDPYHVQRITVSNVTTDGAFVLESARSGSTVTSGSTLWTPRFTTDSSGTFNISGLPSGSTHWYRARNTKYHRIRSAWAYTTAGVATQELTGPSGLTGNDITSKTARLAWTNSTASTGYELEILARTTTESSGSTGGVPNSSDSTTIQPPGFTNYVLRDLSSGTTYKAYVRYRDRFGGFSPSTGIVFPTLTSTALTADTIYDIYFLYGSDSTASTSVF